jgi:hypothetical protein
MPSSIYFVEDDGTMNPFVIDARSSKIFGTAKILKTSSVDDAILRCESMQEDIVFVLDSRMYMSEVARSKVDAILQQHGTDSSAVVEGVPQGVPEDALTGALVTLVLKSMKPKCRIIICSAYVGTIRTALDSSPVFGSLFGQAVDDLLGKRDPKALTEAIKTQLASLCVR